MLGLVTPWLATARRIRHPGQAVPGKPATPFADCRRRGRRPGRRCLIAQPSATARMICARNATRCSVFPAASQDRKVARCSLVNANSTAFIPADYQVRQLVQLRTRPKSCGTSLADGKISGKIAFTLFRDAIRSGKALVFHMAASKFPKRPNRELNRPNRRRAQAPCWAT